MSHVPHIRVEFCISSANGSLRADPEHHSDPSEPENEGSNPHAQPTCRHPHAAVRMPPPACRRPHAAIHMPPSACRRPHAAVRMPPSACRYPHAAVRTPPSACRRPHAAVRVEPACRHPHCRMWILCRFYSHFMQVSCGFHVRSMRVSSRCRHVVSAFPMRARASRNPHATALLRACA